MSDTIATLYAAQVAGGDLLADPVQEAVVARLATLQRRLATHRLARKSSALGWIFGARDRSEAPLRGLYLHGPVGRGKTMLMDLFFRSAPMRLKRRAHFHEFMADVHERVHGIRQEMKRGLHAGGDPVAIVADALKDEAWLLCFDEFHVTDIADAMILGRLFSRLFAAGVVVVATSNVAPDDLYKEGLNRALFLPFIRTLHDYMDVMSVAARTDYRLEKLEGLKIWHVPADAAADRALDEAFRHLTGVAAGTPLDLAMKGRLLHVPQAARGVARFSFEALCAQPLGASDYLRIAHEFHTLVLDHIPVMDFARRNEAKRFITLIDTLYDNKVKLVASAEAPPEGLYRGTEGYEAFEFPRTVSRLIEMGSHAWLELPHGRQDSQADPNSDGLVET